MRGKRGSSKRPRCPWCASDFIGTVVDGKLEWSHPQPDMCPTECRTQHDEITLVGASTRGQYASGWRVATNLELYERRGVITMEMRDAGRIFTDKFRVAGLDELRAVDMAAGLPIGSTHARIEPSERLMAARDYVWSRITVLGGPSSLPGSVAWHVLGMQTSVSRWATERSLNHPHRIDEHAAQGLLIGVLTTLSLDTISRQWRPPRPNYGGSIADGNAAAPVPVL
jgi:hypothetical protein